MKTILIFFFSILLNLVFSQEIRRISKATDDIQSKSKEYVNAIKSSNNLLNKEIAYENKDSLIFLKELDAFFVAFEKNLITDNNYIGFNGKNRKMNYVLLVGNNGYIDAFYYDFEDGKLKLSFVGALNTFIANYKWENPKKARVIHKSSYTFK
ncbi:MAG: hypothetical protein Q8T03_13125 [Bacteroidota bacterium]|nr:hypothetical protein [Bacteroidota bacterium]